MFCLWLARERIDNIRADRKSSARGIIGGFLLRRTMSTSRNAARKLRRRKGEGWKERFLMSPKRRYQGD